MLMLSVFFIDSRIHEPIKASFCDIFLRVQSLSLIVKYCTPPEVRYQPLSAMTTPSHDHIQYEAIHTFTYPTMDEPPLGLPPIETTVLLLGDSDVGKSTFLS